MMRKPLQGVLCGSIQIEALKGERCAAVELVITLLNLRGFLPGHGLMRGEPGRSSARGKWGGSEVTI